MVSFLFLLACLAAIALADVPLCEWCWPVAGGNWLAERLMLSVAVQVAVVGWAWWITQQAEDKLRQKPHNRSHVLAQLERHRQWHTAFWFLNVLVCGAIAGWGQAIREDGGLAVIPLIDEVLILWPVLWPMLMSWALFYRVEQTLHRLSNFPFPPMSLKEYLVYQVRLQWLLILVPLLGMLAYDDLFRLCFPPENETAASDWQWAGPMLMMLGGFPFLMRYVWPTHRLPSGALRQRLEIACRRMKVEVREFLVWGTGRRISNAAVVGLFRWQRFVLFSDLLIAHLNDEELESVLAHEAGHVRHHHLLLRLLAVFSPVFLLAWFDAFAPVPLLDSLSHFATWSWPFLLLMLLLLLISFPLLLLTFAAYSRRLETQADWFACQATSAACFISSLEKVAQLNGLPLHRHDWQHGSIAVRIAWLQTATLHPSLASSLERRLHRLALFLYLFSLLSLLVWFGS